MNLLMFRTLPRQARRKFLLRYLRVDEARLRDVEIHLAQQRAEVREALSLVYEVYAAKGKVGPNPARMHVTKHNAQTASLIFAARQSDRVVGTIAVIPDSPLGLPIDCMAHENLDNLRADGLKICEVGCAASAADFRGSGLALYLYRAAIQAAVQEGFDVIVMSAQPKGALIFKELLVFQSFGRPAHNTSLNNRQPSIALRLDLRTCEGRGYERFDRLTDYEHSPHFLFYGKDVPQIQLPQHFAVTPERIEASADLINARPEVFQQLTPSERTYLKSAVPTADWATESPSTPGRPTFQPQKGALCSPLLPQVG